jgi:hypothetical protein
METSEKLIAVLCDPEGEVCIDGSDEDRKMLQKAIEEVKELERPKSIEERLLGHPSVIRTSAGWFGYNENGDWVILKGND